MCLDGTQNSPEQEVKPVGGHKLYKPTNVLKTFRAIRPVDDEGVSQIAYYSEGVGSMIGEDTVYAKVEVWVDRIFGGVAAVGYGSRVKSAYRFLVANYRPGDQILVFGFSRGAAEAQTLVRFIAWVGGILHKEAAGGLLHKRNEYWIPELYEGFRRSCTADEVFAEIRRRSNDAVIGVTRPAKLTCRGERDLVEQPQPRSAAQRGWIYNPQAAQIEFLGVYDTVVSVGWHLIPARQARKYAYLVDKIPPTIVKTIRQALAIDERRWDYSPQVWQPSDLEPQEDGVRPLVQLWFPGVHSNVGGGYPHDEMANGAFTWVVGEAEKIAHLAVDHDYLHFFEENQDPCADPCRPDSDGLGWKILDLVRCKTFRGVRELATWDEDGSWEKSGLGFHESLGTLVLCDRTYRPKNLLEHLGKNPHRIDDFPSHRCEIGQIVDDFNGKV